MAASGPRDQDSLDPQCLSGFRKNEKFEIEHSDVILTVDNGDFIFLDCAYEELLQSLGPINDTSSVPWTMFNDNVQMGFFDVYDQYILNMLYDPAHQGRHDRAGGQGGPAGGPDRRAGLGAKKVQWIGCRLGVRPRTLVIRARRCDRHRFAIKVDSYGSPLRGNDGMYAGSYALFSNSSRPISMRRISLVPAPIS